MAGVKRGTRDQAPSRRSPGGRAPGDDVSGPRVSGQPVSNRRASTRRRAPLGVVDYTLVKRAVLRDFQRGLLSRLDICDAHPELMRAARYVGQEIPRPCPVCDDRRLRVLAYVFADELKRDNGRVWTVDRGVALAAECRDGACYVVEVCTGCSWNHLSEAFLGRDAV